MTTIVYRAGVMAGDTQKIAGGWITPGVQQKVFRRERDGALIGIVGDLGAGLRVLKWIVDDAETPHTQPAGADATVILALPDGTISVFEGGGRIEQGRPIFYANGSGMPVAYGAFSMGATATQAAEIASRFDPYTGIEIVSVRHNEPA